jgi:transcription termination factor NusB
MLPTVAQDPRFRAGRALVQKGQAAAAVNVFASLLEKARTTFGEAHVETAPAYYEYGNALLRGAPEEEEEGDDEASTAEEGDSTTTDHDRKRQAAAQAAMQRLAPAEDEKQDKEEDQKPAAQEDASSPKEEDPSSEQDDNGSDDDEPSDVALALEMMETAWSILDDYVSSSNEDEDTPASPKVYLAWAREQLPRYLTGIGDTLSSLTRHADAADAYARALAHRLERVQQHVDAKTTRTVDHLKCRRLLVEANILLAQEFLAGPPDQDVITTETQIVLVTAAGKIDYARGYYDKARDELQETVLLMGEMAAQGLDVAAEKEDICFVSTMVMGVGMKLAELDELAAAATLEQPVKKKSKKE